jgi:putative transposase
LAQRRGRLIPEAERRKILELVDETKQAGARQQAACNIVGIAPRTIQRWKARTSLKDKRGTKTTPPRNKLSDDEKIQLLCIVNQPQYASLSPAKIVPLLADKGVYLASESTFYRLLKAERQLRHRHISKPRRVHKPRALRAVAANQIYSWDITYLSTAIAGRFFYLYLIMDVYSRKIVGWQVYERESAEYASDVLEASCQEEGVKKNQVTLHSDNGSPMKGATMLATLQRLGVIPSFSRPGVSNDNPYSEALFRTLKYTPMYPQQPFATLQIAREWVSTFVKWYNNEHLHSGIKFVTPVQRHKGLDEAILQHRNIVYLKAKSMFPHRWSKNTRNWNKDKEVLLNPEKCKNAKYQLRVAV